MDLINKTINGDAIEQIKVFPDNYFDSIVTDPPAGISFMGKKWDDDKGGRDHWIKWLSEVFIEAKRTLKPGGHALVWSLPRTSHWTGMALEDAGFEVRDIVHHIFGSGFPKSLDISKQIDKQAGVEREIIGTKQHSTNLETALNNKTGYLQDDANRNNTKMFGYGEENITIASTPEAKQWSGWGTALKPAVECWWLVRKPLSENTVADNVLKWGVGGLNIEECRVEIPENDKENYEFNNNGLSRMKRPEGEKLGQFDGGWKIDKTKRETPQGRFPANLIHDGSDEVLAHFPYSKSGAMTKPYVYKNNGFSLGAPAGSTKQIHESNEGSAARFFYCAKPSRAERDRGLEHENEKPIPYSDYRENMDTTKSYVSFYPDGTPRPMNKGKNNHPTVKAQALMKYLIKMITPPGGIVLDMFAGSGSTCVAADDLGFRYIGIEQELENCKIAEQRLKGKLKGNSSLDAYNNV